MKAPYVYVKYLDIDLLFFFWEAFNSFENVFSLLKVTFHSFFGFLRQHFVSLRHIYFVCDSTYKVVSTYTLVVQ